MRENDFRKFCKFSSVFSEQKTTGIQRDWRPALCCIKKKEERKKRNVNNRKI